MQSATMARCTSGAACSEISHLKKNGIVQKKEEETHIPQPWATPHLLTYKWLEPRAVIRERISAATPDARTKNNKRPRYFSTFPPHTTPHPGGRRRTADGGTARARAWSVCGSTGPHTHTHVRCRSVGLEIRKIRSVVGFSEIRKKRPQLH